MILCGIYLVVVECHNFYNGGFKMFPINSKKISIFKG